MNDHTLPSEPIHEHERADPGRPADRSIAGLMRHFIDEVAALLRDEVTLAKGEVGDSINGLKAGIASIVGGAIVLIAGLVVLLDAVVLALYLLLPRPLWLSPLIVGIVVLAIGGVMLAAGRSKLSPRTLKPDRTMAETDRDRRLLKERLT
jgi:uncharacterized integral membrane protein